MSVSTAPGNAAEVEHSGVVDKQRHIRGSGRQRGDRVALLADWLAQPDIAAGRLIDVFPDMEATATNFDGAVWLLYVSRDHLPRRVRAVVDFFKTRLGRPA